LTDLRYWTRDSPHCAEAIKKAAIAENVADTGYDILKLKFPFRSIFGQAQIGNWRKHSSHHLSLSHARFARGAERTNNSTRT
jgi:hypothetical protein